MLRRCRRPSFGAYVSELADVDANVSLSHVELFSPPFVFSSLPLFRGKGHVGAVGVGILLGFTTRLTQR